MILEHRSGELSLRRAGFGQFSQFASTPLLRWQQPSPDQIQVGQRKDGEQPRRVFRQPAVANFTETPELLDHMEDVFDCALEHRSAGG